MTCLSFRMELLHKASFNSQQLVA